MKIRMMMTIVAAILAVSGYATAEGRTEMKKDRWVYKEAAVFNHVVGNTRLVGNFLAEPGRCDVTMFATRAEDSELRLPMRRFAAPIAAGAHNRFEIGPTSALTISCAPKADAIGIEAETKAGAPGVSNP